MRLNRNGKPYKAPDATRIQCRIKSSDGLIYHPTKAPVGLSKCGIMLELKPKQNDFIFESVSRAEHAIHHTITFLKQIGIDEFDFVIERI